MKANYLVKLPAFIDQKGARRPPTICVVGDDPFGDALDRAASDAALGARPPVVRRMATIGKGSGCTVVYAAGSKAQGVDAILAAVRGQSVLTVTDGAGARSTTGRGAVQFLQRGSRVRFRFDEAAAAANGVVLSSKLLNLAARSAP